MQCLTVLIAVILNSHLIVYKLKVLHCVQDYWSQPAKQIVRRYRQRQRQQAGGDDLVVTRSWHECGYPDCGKSFLHKQHLRRHQTQKHGRTPTRVIGLQRVWVKPGDVNGGQICNSTGMTFYCFVSTSIFRMCHFREAVLCGLKSD